MQIWKLVKLWSCMVTEAFISLGSDFTFKLSPLARISPIWSPSTTQFSRIRVLLKKQYCWTLHVGLFLPREKRVKKCQLPTSYEENHVEKLRNALLRSKASTLTFAAVVARSFSLTTSYWHQNVKNSQCGPEMMRGNCWSRNFMPIFASKRWKLYPPNKRTQKHKTYLRNRIGAISRRFEQSEALVCKYSVPIKENLRYFQILNPLKLKTSFSH